MTIVVLAGFAGSGKSELARMLAQSLGWALLDKDTISRPFVEALNTKLSGDPHDRNSETYLKYVRPLEYEVLQDVIDENLAEGLSVIAAAPYLKELSDPRWLQQLRHHAAKYNSQVVLLWVDCDAESMKARIIARGAHRDHWKLSNWDRYAKTLQKDVFASQAQAVIDNSAHSLAPLRYAANQLVERLR